MYRTYTAPPPWLLFGPRAEGGRCGPHRMHRHHRWGRGPGGFGPRARRGDVRSALLLLLEEEPRNGYGLMQEIERRSDGLWRPSPGSVYPALAQLEDEGLVTTVEQEGKRLFTLTDEGRAHVEANRERLGQPWDAAGAGHPEGVGALLSSSAQLAMAIQQIGRGGTTEQLEAARKVVDDARRALYRLLAGDEPPTEGEEPREV
jgi:DNA-binding PadR family transcriptional regulator